MPLRRSEPESFAPTFPNPMKPIFMMCLPMRRLIPCRTLLKGASRKRRDRVAFLRIFVVVVFA